MTDDKPAAPAPEPVAWMLNTGHGRQVVAGKNPAPDLMWNGRPAWVPLYTHPAPVAAPAPEPLIVSKECAERGCCAHDPRIDTDGVAVYPAAPAPDVEFLRSEAERAWREVDFIAKERTEHLEWRTKLANDLDDCARLRVVLPRTVNTLYMVARERARKA